LQQNTVKGKQALSGAKGKETAPVKSVSGKSSSWSKTGELPSKPSTIRSKRPEYKAQETRRQEVLSKLRAENKSTQTSRTFKALKGQKISDKQGFISTVNSKRTTVKAFKSLKKLVREQPIAESSLKELRVTPKEKAQKSFKALRGKAIADKPVRQKMSPTVKTYKALRRARVSNKSGAIKNFTANTATARTFKALKNKPVASKELLSIRMKSVTRASFKNLRAKPILQKNFSQVLTEHTARSVRNVKSLRGNTVAVRNLESLQTRMQKMSFPENMSIYDNKVFITREDVDKIKAREKQAKKHILKY